MDLLERTEPRRARYEGVNPEDFATALVAGGDAQIVRLFPEAGIYTAARQLMYHWTLIVGLIGDRTGWEDQWCYETAEGVIGALAEWDAGAGGEPTGWHRNPRTGRRRDEGRPEREYVWW